MATSPSVTVCLCLGDFQKLNRVSFVVKLKGRLEILKTRIQMSTSLGWRMQKCQASTFMILRKSQLTPKENVCRLPYECKNSFISTIKWHLLKSTLSYVAGCNDVSGQSLVSEFRHVEEHLFGKHKLFKLQLHWCTKKDSHPSKTS